MNFMQLVESAKKEEDLTSENIRLKREESSIYDRNQMKLLNTKLNEISEDLSVIPATVILSDVRSAIEVKKGSFTLSIEIFFTKEIWNMFLLSFIESSAFNAEESSETAETVDDVLNVIARKIGAFLARQA